MKILNKMGVILFITLLLFSFSVTSFASNTGYIVDAGYYTPIFNLTGFGNYKGVSGSVVTMPSGVLINDSMFTSVGEEWSCINNQNWQGLYNDGYTFGTHSASQTVRYYTTEWTDNLYSLRSETYISSYNNISQLTLMGFYEEAYVNQTYVDNQRAELGYKVFDGFKFVWNPADVAAGSAYSQSLLVNWKQYEMVGDLPQLVEREYLVESFSEDTYYETESGGYVSTLPLFDFENPDLLSIVSNQVRAAEGDYYFTDISVGLVVNNLQGLYIYSTYDDINKLSEDVGSYLENVNSITINFDEISYTDWLINGVGGFMEFEIIPGFSLAGIMAAIIAILLLKSFLRIFAGG